MEQSAKSLKMVQAYEDGGRVEYGGKKQKGAHMLSTPKAEVCFAPLAQEKRKPWLHVRSPLYPPPHL